MGRASTKVLITVPLTFVVPFIVLPSVIAVPLIVIEVDDFEGVRPGHELALSLGIERQERGPEVLAKIPIGEARTGAVPA
jgi:hypothetical protein